MKSTIKWWERLCCTVPRCCKLIKPTPTPPGPTPEPPIPPDPGPPTPVPPTEDEITWFNIYDQYLGYNDTYVLTQGLESDNALTANQYDGQLCNFRMADYRQTTTPYWLQADHQNTIYTHYGDTSGWVIPGYFCQSEGLAERYVRMGDAAALTDLNSLMNNGNYMYTVPGQTGLNDQGRTPQTRHEISREFAYCIMGYIQLARFQALTAAQVLRRDQCFNDTLIIADDWSGNIGQPPASQQATYCRPFIVSLSARSIIAYCETVASPVQRTAAIAKLSQLGTYVWTWCWVEASKAMTYTDRIGVNPPDAWAAAEDGLPAPDLSMLIAPWFAWLWSVTRNTTWKDRALAIFEGSIPRFNDEGFQVSGAYLGTPGAPVGKHINQGLFWGPKYMEWIRA